VKQIDTANTLGALALAIVDGFSSKIYDQVGLQSIDSTALNVIGFREDISIRELACLLNLSHAGAVRCVDRLAAAMQVERTPGADARTLALRLTPSGHSAWALQRHTRMACLNDLIDDLPDAKRHALNEVISILLQKLALSAESGERICRLCDENTCTPARCPITEE
jgi:DNA-binding MarR family transcriptional regulator